MKIFALACLLLCLAQSYANIVTLSNKRLGHYVQDCLVKINMDSDSSKKVENISDEAKTCFLACMFEKAKIIRSDGTVNTEPDEGNPAALSVISDCTEQAGSDVCKLAWCLRRSGKFSIRIKSNAPRYD